MIDTLKEFDEACTKLLCHWEVSLHYFNKN